MSGMACATVPLAVAVRENHDRKHRTWSDPKSLADVFSCARWTHLDWPIPCRISGTFVVRRCVCSSYVFSLKACFCTWKTQTRNENADLIQNAANARTIGRRYRIAISPELCAPSRSGTYAFACRLKLCRTVRSTHCSRFRVFFECARRDHFRRTISCKSDNQRVYVLLRCAGQAVAVFRNCPHTSDHRIWTPWLRVFASRAGPDDGMTENAFYMFRT